jgi:hypothetical protein
MTSLPHSLLRMCPTHCIVSEWTCVCNSILCQIKEVVSVIQVLSGSEIVFCLIICILTTGYVDLSLFGMTQERWLYADVLLRGNSVFHHLGGMTSQTVPRTSSHKLVIVQSILIIYTNCKETIIRKRNCVSILIYYYLLLLLTITENRLVIFTNVLQKPAFTNFRVEEWARYERMICSVRNMRSELGFWVNQCKLTALHKAVLSKQKQTPWPLVRERTIPTERPPLVDEI